MKNIICVISVFMLMPMMGIRNGMAVILILCALYLCNWINRKFGQRFSCGDSSNDVMIWDQNMHQQVPMINSIENILNGNKFL